MKYDISTIHAGKTYQLNLAQTELRNFSKVERCPACEASGRWEEIVALGGVRLEESMRVVACGACGHVTYDRLPSDAWLDAFYGSTWDQANQASPEQTFAQKTLPPESFRHFFSLGLPKDSAILDFGCGFGNVMSLLSGQGYTAVHGVEPSSHRAKFASGLFPGRVRKGSVAEAAATAEAVGGFDVIISSHVVEHLLDPFAILGALRRLLRPGGRFYIMVPELFAEPEVHTVLFFPHLHQFSKPSFRRLFDRLGLEAYTWKDARDEMVVMGLTASAQRPGPEFLPISAETDARDVGAFLRSPWKVTGSGTKILNFWRPEPSAAGSARGFQYLSGPKALSAGALKALTSGKEFSVRDRWTSRYLRWTNKLLPGAKLRSKRLMAVRPEGDSEIPWLVAEGDKIPLLIK